MQIKSGATFDVVWIDAFLQTRLSSNKRPRSHEQIADALRDDAGNVRRSMPREKQRVWTDSDRRFATDVAALRMSNQSLDPSVGYAA